MTSKAPLREHYLWTLELKRRGRTAVSVLRNTKEELGSSKVRCDGSVGSGDGQGT